MNLLVNVVWSKGKLEIDQLVPKINMLIKLDKLNDKIARPSV